MKLRKLIVVFFFIVVFGLPVAWYLFLQAFGENRFDLPVLESIQNECLSNNESKVYLDSITLSSNPNEKSRIVTRLSRQSVLNWSIIDFTQCGLDGSIILMDSLDQVRGVYEVNREEVDRFLAEIDIYLLNYANK
ncbi:MAG: hypothetical protein ACI83W_000654 [Marinoscillum sp.]|jgi:hypothetical protein